MFKVGDKVTVKQNTIWSAAFRGAVGKVVFVSDLGGIVKAEFSEAGMRGKVLLKAEELEKTEE